MLISDVMTDFAGEIGAEGGFYTTSEGRISIDEINIGQAASQALNKPAGKYFVLGFDRLELNRAELLEAMHKCIKRLIKFKKSEKAMVIGLGNEMLTADSFGVLTAKLVDAKINSIYSITPGVAAQSGMESADYISILATAALPDHIIMVDSLFTQNHSNLLESIQIANAPLGAGSGIDKKRDSLAKLPKAKSVLSIGYTTTASLQLPNRQACVVTPADCDAYVTTISSIAAEALNMSLSLTGGGG
ncbi:MAG: GPR endopeptidase [Eubacteriaceae bacterium]|nr:GPR endopeptidase [Eubacteriaceae bacterium]